MAYHLESDMYCKMVWNEQRCAITIAWFWRCFRKMLWVRYLLEHGKIEWQYSEQFKQIKHNDEQIQDVSTPRLELAAAELLSRFFAVVREAMEL